MGYGRTNRPADTQTHHTHAPLEYPITFIFHVLTNGLWTDGPMDGPTDGRKDGWMDGRTHLLIDMRGRKSSYLVKRKQRFPLAISDHFKSSFFINAIPASDLDLILIP